MSTIQAEYIAITEAIKEALWLKGILAQLGILQKSIKIHFDSSSAKYLSKNPTQHERTENINVKLHFIIIEMSEEVIK